MTKEFLEECIDMFVRLPCSGVPLMTDVSRNVNVSVLIVYSLLQMKASYAVQLLSMEYLV